MKKIYFTIIVLLSITSYSQYISNTNVSADNYTKDLRHNGTLAIGDNIIDNKNFTSLQVKYSALDKNILIPIRNGSGGFEIALAGGPGYWDTYAKAGDGIIRIMGGKNMYFGYGSTTDANNLPNGYGVQKFAFGDNTGTSTGKTMSVYNTGKVTIGTDTYDLSGYRLFVKDGIKTERLKVEVASENQWADYVFKENYALPTLKEIEQHIQEKGHLPNIPSAKEIVKEGGIEQGELNAKLLEKIEELTLYIIEQNKRIEKLEEK
jgi:hypothetical protein